MFYQLLAVILCSGVWILYSDKNVYTIVNDAFFMHAMRANPYGVPYMVLGEQK